MWKVSNPWPLSTVYAKKSDMFYTLVSSYFVVYTVTIAKKTPLYARQLTLLTPSCSSAEKEEIDEEDESQAFPL